MCTSRAKFLSVRLIGGGVSSWCRKSSSVANGVNGAKEGSVLELGFIKVVGEGESKLLSYASTLTLKGLYTETVNETLQLSGIKLSALTQASAYRAIRDGRRNSPRESQLLDRSATNKNLERCSARLASILIDSEIPSHERIWRSIRCKDFSRPVRYFLWMTFHGGYKVGDYWTRMDKPELKERGKVFQHKTTRGNAITHSILNGYVGLRLSLWGIATPSST